MVPTSGEVVGLMSYAQEIVAIFSAFGTAASFLSLNSTLHFETQSEVLNKILRLLYLSDSKFEVSNLSPLITGTNLVLLSSLFVGTNISLNNKVAKNGAIARLCWVSIFLTAGLCTFAGATAAELFLVFLPPFISTSLVLGSSLTPNGKNEGIHKEDLDSKGYGIHLV